MVPTEPSEEIRQQAQDLRARLEEANRRYYRDDNPHIVDAEYDRLFRDLVALEQEHPALCTPDSPTQRVGTAPLDAFKKAEHRVPMLSLDNAFDADDIHAWVGRMPRWLGDEEAAAQLTFSSEPKLDGISVSLSFERGHLIRAATRGDGEVGEDITQNVRTIRSLPLELATDTPPEWAEIRGEIYVTKEDFARFNAARSEEEGRYVNPRNFAGGSLRQLDSKITAGRPLRIALYHLALPDEELQRLAKTQGEVLALLAKWGLPTAREFSQHDLDPDGLIAAYEDIVSQRANIPFEVDGMVVKVDQLAAWPKLGTRSRSPRWAIAWKLPAQEAMTVLEAIRVSVGRTGALTPVAALAPVFVAGVTVSSATLHNQDEIDRLDVRIGDTVVVQRAGDVIPKVTKVITAARQGDPERYTMPLECPACATPSVKTEDEVVRRCPNPTCPAKVRARVRHFASQNALDIRGLGDKLVEQLVEGDRVRTPADLFRLDQETLAGLERMGDKSAANLIAALETAKTARLDRAIFALGMRHVGESVAKIIAREAGSLEGLRELDQDLLEALDEVGPIVAESVMTWLGDPENQRLLDELTELGLRPTPLPAVPEGDGAAGEGLLAGHLVVVTGTLPTRTRDEAHQLLEEHGAAIAKSVTKKTTFVLAGSKAGSKLKKAETLAIPVLAEPELEAWIDDGEVPASIT